MSPVFELPPPTAALGPKGAPPSTTAEPRDPNHDPQAAMAACCASSVSAMAPPWYTSTYFAIP